MKTEKKTAEELLREFADKHKKHHWTIEKDADGKRYMQKHDNSEEIFSDLNALLDKLMLTEEPKIRVVYATELNGPQERVLELSELLRFIQRFKVLSLEWFRSRMKGEEKYTDDLTAVEVGDTLISRTGEKYVVTEIDKDECGDLRFWEDNIAFAKQYPPYHNMRTKPPFWRIVKGESK
jgi:hypothetical protein